MLGFCTPWFPVATWQSFDNIARKHQSQVGPRRSATAVRRFQRRSQYPICAEVPSPNQQSAHEDVLSFGRIRKGTPSDALTMSMLILSCGMNPRLGDITNFLVFETTDGQVVGGGQVRPGNPGELASLAVVADWRGRGIGSAISRSLVEREETVRDLCLLCLTRAIGFYSGLGFTLCESASELPQRLQIEKKLGGFVASVVAPGNDVVGMVRKRKL